jgi:curved DNA-binding protein
MNYYDILGVSRQATPQEIKAAYRKLAMEHHPDRGGDESTFQKINQAYDTLSDNNKRGMYDDQMNPRMNGSPHQRSFEDIHDMFNQMFGAGRGFDFGRGRSGHGRTRAKNLDLNIRCKITLLDSFLGKEIEAAYLLPSGRKETAVITIPPGIENGNVLKLKNMGDDTYPQVDRGDLNVTVLVAEDLNFSRRNDDITTIIEIDAIEAMIGCTKPIETIDGKILNIKIKPGMTHGGEYAAKGLGFKSLRTGIVGDFVTIIYIKIPEITDKDIKKKLEEIRNAINNLPK